MLRIFAAAAIIAASAASAEAKDQEQTNIWSAVSQPSSGAPQAIGSYSNGCQQGAQILPEHGTGYYDIRRFRHRYFSQPSTIALVQRIGRYVAQTTGEEILIGDLSQPIGGLMSYAHVSHQNGLDVDIYFASMPAGTVPDKDYDPPLVVDKAAGTMILERWKPAYRNALYAAAADPSTTRIFVNPIIKQYLCRTEKDTSWLEKIRPWGGHDEHFHIRIACPPDSPLCVSQPPIPSGDGCDADLDHWVQSQSDSILHPKPKKPAPPKPRPKPPVACTALRLQMQGK